MLPVNAGVNAICRLARTYRAPKITRGMEFLCSDALEIDCGRAKYSENAKQMHPTMEADAFATRT